MYSAKQGLEATQTFFRSALAEGVLLENAIVQFMERHGIRGKVDSTGSLLILDYDQIRCKFDAPHGFVCRGLILDARSFDLVSMPLNKFWNNGEGKAATLDWTTAQALDKLDGSMVQRFFNPHTNQFECSTRFQLPEDTIKNKPSDHATTWAQLISRCLKDWEEILLTQPKDETWVFEVMCPLNQVVVRHAGYSAKILAARNNKTLEETPFDSLPGGPERRPKSYQFTSAAEVAAFANTFAATENEGFVVCDAGFNRIKIKSDEYVRLHHLRNGINSVRSLLMMARGNDYEEVVAHFPEFKPDLDTLAGLINEVITQHEDAYEKYKTIESQKDFALAIQAAVEYKNALFLVRAKKQPSVRAAFLALDETPFVRIFKERAKKLLGDKYADEEPQT